ncbi:MAG: YitT family protein [Saprospiraceae bacterium]|nr:YitT family protein [Saprospiraceae bacterium]
MKRILKIHENEFIRRTILHRQIKDVLFISLGVFMAGIGLKCFLLPSHFLDGGAMGVSLLLNIQTGIGLSFLIILVNLPFIILGTRQISLQFGIKSSLAIIALAMLVYFVEFPVVTVDKLLIAVFGGFFLGAGIGLSIRGGSVIDGTEVLAIAVSRRSSLTVGDFIAVFNIVLFAVAALIVNIETAMYSMLTYLAASKTVDFIINGIEEYIGIMIVSEASEDIKQTIADKIGRGFTVFKSEGGHGKKGTSLEDKNVLFCVVTRLEVTRVLLEIDKIDPDAFVIQYPIKDTRGGMIKKRPLH